MKKRVLIIFLLIVSVILSGLYTYKYLNLPISINGITYAEGVNEDKTKTVTVNVDVPNLFPVSCTVGDVTSNDCKFNLKNGNYTLKINNVIRQDEIDFNVNTNEIISISLNVELFHIAVGENFSIQPTIEKIGEPNTKLIYSSGDENIATVDSDGIVTGIAPGEVIISVNASNGTTNTVKFVVTDMIVKPVFNLDKPKLNACGVYSKEDNDFLDALLAERVDYAGRGTRGGTIAAARFLTLSFPYRVTYFYEHGRLDTYYPGQRKVDGEGRYHHLGLYLNESRYANIDDNLVKEKKATWGCPLTNYDDTDGWAVGSKRPNGLDCSGFVTWALMNGGTDVGDIGAGIVEGVKDMSDLGTRHPLTYEYANKGDYKIGDVIARNGHTALLVGKDDEYLYIAESLLYGVRTVKYSYKQRGSKLYTLYEYIEDMTDVYSGEGIYTTMFQTN